MRWILFSLKFVSLFQSGVKKKKKKEWKIPVQIDLSSMCMTHGCSRLQAGAWSEGKDMHVHKREEWGGGETGWTALCHAQNKILWGGGGVFVKGLWLSKPADLKQLGWLLFFLVSGCGSCCPISSRPVCPHRRRYSNNKRRWTNKLSRAGVSDPAPPGPRLHVLEGSLLQNTWFNQWVVNVQPTGVLGQGNMSNMLVAREDQDWTGVQS